MEKNEIETLPGYKWIIKSECFLDGVPSIGKRVSVDSVLMYLSLGLTPEDISRHYDIQKEAVLEAILFARNEVAKNCNSNRI